MFPTIGAVVVLFVVSMVCVVGTCAVIKHLKTSYLQEQLCSLYAKEAPTPEDKQKMSDVGKQVQAYSGPLDLGLGVVVVMFVASMLCIFLGRSWSPMTASVSAYHSPGHFVEFQDGESAPNKEAFLKSGRIVDEGSGT